jgi:3-carboxy-cis,cis-muconate cycloisomerase
MSASLMQEHERSVGRWHAEWSPLPEIVCLTGGAIKHAGELFSHLDVNVTRMRENIDVTRGLVFAESIAIAIGKEIGKSEAEELVKLACQRAREKDCHLHKILSQDPTLSRVLDQATLEQIFRPENALGIANQLIERVLMQGTENEPASE